MMAFEILKSIVQQLIVLKDGLEVHALVFKQNGHLEWRRLHFQNDPCSSDLWDIPHFEKNLEFAWSKDRNDLRKPWVESNGRRPHLAEWLMFCLDVQARSRRQEAAAAALKTQLQSGALSILTEIALSLDSRIIQVTSKLSDFRKFALGRKSSWAASKCTCRPNPARAPAVLHQIRLTSKLRQACGERPSMMWGILLWK